MFLLRYVQLCFEREREIVSLEYVDLSKNQNCPENLYISILKFKDLKGLFVIFLSIDRNINKVKETIESC